MRVLISFLVATLLCLSAPAFAQAGGRIVEVQVPAPALAGNLLETPTVQPASIYLPPGYARGQHRYPVIYLLHGYADTRATWTDFVRVKGVMDRAIAGHRIPETILVMPDATNVYGGGFYHNSPVAGRWLDYIADNLIAFTDTHYRTLARAGGRALVGWSMGGHGALYIAMQRPGLYAAVYAISPCCLGPAEDLGAGNDAWRRLATLTPAQVAAAEQAHDFSILAGIAFMTALSPAPDAGPLFVRPPFKLENGRITPDSAAYEHYAAQFPLNQIDAHTAAALAGLRALGFDYGLHDQYAHIPPTTRAFSARLAELGVPHRFEVYDGDHRDHVAARFEAVVLPFVASALDAPQ